MSHMRIVFIHQNFPAQFKYLAPCLVKRGHEVLALCVNAVQDEQAMQGVRVVRYSIKTGSTPNVHPWAVDVETKAIRAQYAYMAMLQLKEQGLQPDCVIAHPGWGESLCVKEVWPHTQLAIYAEFFYHAKGADCDFDAEFMSDKYSEPRIRFKNINNLMHFEIADAGISPTHWQASTFPEHFRSKITVIHDGIDTQSCQPNPNIHIALHAQLNLTKNDEVITFVNRNLEPHRGYHIFMRALPAILKRRPNARVLIVGGDNVSYGARPEAYGDQYPHYKDFKSWKDIFYAEVASQLSDEQKARIHFLGHIPYNLFIPLLQLSTVHVYLTYPFVLSWSLLEAMSCACAIVASDTPPLREAITHNETGRLVNFFDVGALADEVCYLLENPDERRRLGENARAFAVKNYDLETVCLPKQVTWVEGLCRGL